MDAIKKRIKTTVHCTVIFLLSLLAFLVPAQAVSVKSVAPAFELSTLSGTRMSLAQNKGKVVVVHFWASWCAPCKTEFPRLNDLAKSYSADDVSLMAISEDQTSSNVDRFLKKHISGPLRAEILLDYSGKTAEAYGNKAMPMTYIVDRQGNVRFIHTGFQKDDEASWRKEIDQILGDR